MIAAQKTYCLVDFALWLDYPLPSNIGHKRKVDAHISKRDRASTADCVIEVNTEVEMIRCPGGYFIYKLKEALEKSDCNNQQWIFYASQGMCNFTIG